MTVENTNPIQHFTANGETTVFAISFAVEGKDNIKVTVNGSVVSVNDYSYDALTKAVVFNAAPEDGAEVVVDRVTSLDRSINYQTYDNSFRPETLNYDLDRIWHVLQEDHITDANIVARIKDEIEWRRTHNTEWDLLAQAREKGLFNALKSYMDTIGAMSVPNLFDGVTDNVVITEEGVSQRVTNRDLKQAQAELQASLEELDALAVANLQASKDYTDAEKTRAVEAEAELAQKVLDEKAKRELADVDLQTQINTLGVGNRAYKTYADMVADKANITSKSKITVTNDTDATKNGDYQYDGTNFTKSVYDVLTQSKAYADANPLFKKVQLVAGNDLNNITKTGIYYHWGSNLSSTQLLNAPEYVSGNALFGTLVVYNPIEGESSALTQIFYPHTDGYGPYIRKRSQAGVFPAWSKLTTSSNQHNVNLITTEGTDVLELPLGNYCWASLVMGNSFLNMPNAPYKFGRLEVKAGGSGHGSNYKVVVFYPYGRDKNYYMNTNYEANTWTGWRTYKDYDTLLSELNNTYPTKTELSTTIAGSLDTLTKLNYFGKKYSDSDLTGTGLYAAAYYAGYNSTTDSKGATFNSIIGRLSGSGAGDTEYRVYMGSKVSVGVLGNSVPQANVNNPDFSGVCLSFPTGDTGKAQTIKLDKVVSIPANTPFVIVFRKTVLSSFRIGFSSAVTGSLDKRGFSMWAQAQEWGEFGIAAASPDIGYVQTGFQLQLNIESDGQGSTTNLLDSYKPTLVIPPKFYAMEGLETHIYPEHLLVEDHKLYEHDITCNRGSQRVRGYVWTPTAADPIGNYALTWALHDKQKGELLTSATSTIVLADKNAKSGITKKVSVIGDSLVNGTVITQRLLDVAANDSMKIELIGTRGTGTNKHEGRGGWTINDYTGTGRTYYQFTVSGITVIPAINATTYTVGGAVFMVQETAINSGSGTISCNLVSGTAPTNGTTGILTKTNTSGGDSSISFSNVQPVSGNPFWNEATGKLDYTNYLTKNSIANAPDVVVIQLGVNDTFGLTSDIAVADFAVTALPKLDALISAIKATNSAVKIIVATPPNYADQNAFGTNYACGQTSWRAKRNIVIFNSKLIQQYSNKEAQNIYVVGSGYNVDTENNFPSGTTQINAHNTNTVTVQTNGVHPDISGYRQIGDALFACIKVVA